MNEVNILRNDLFFSYGINCKDANTPLASIGLNDLYEKLSSASEYDLINFTKNLRSVLRYSNERYRSMKTGLPFFSCSIFQPAFRSVQNFQAAYGLIIDIDDKNTISDELIEKFKGDLRIALGYISPSNMGIKLVFGFDEPILDSYQYTTIYKYFSYQFGVQYHLSDCIDQKNCDVSRISFLCHDPSAWYNDDFIPLAWKEWEIGQEYITDLKENEIVSEDGLSNTAYKQIMTLLDSKPKLPKRKIPVMREISEILPALIDELDGYGIQIESSESIQYGAKLKVAKGVARGELNLYCGKQGYKVVISPRNGTDHELNEVSRHIVQGVVMRY